MDSVSQCEGAVATYKKAMNRLDSYTPLGYSLCGVVVEVGQGAERVPGRPAGRGGGQRVRAARRVQLGPGQHVRPRAAADVSPEHAAFSTVGAIAMQGVRRAEVSLGDTALVIGLGLVGQLTVRLLIAAGVRVVGLDMIAERCQLAEKAGAVRCAAPDADGVAAVQEAR